MARWTVDSPTTLEFDGVVALRVRVISGSVAVLSTSERPCLDVESVTGQPLLVTHEAGILTITYQDLSWEGLLGWLRPEAHSATITVAVPKDCPAQIGVVNASTLVSGTDAKTSVRSLAGNITLDGVMGKVVADTVSGDVNAQGAGGKIDFKSASGDLTLADATVSHLTARTLSGRITADLAEACGALRISTVSGPVIVRVPRDASTRVQLRSTVGRVRSEFPGLDSADKDGASQDSSDKDGASQDGASVGWAGVGWAGRASANALSGTLGAGGSGSGRLSVTTMSGQVTLLERSGPHTPGPQAEGDAA